MHFDLRRTAFLGVSLHENAAEASSPYEGDWINVYGTSDAYGAGNAKDAVEALIALGDTAGTPDSYKITITAYQADSIDGSGEPVGEEVMTQIYFNDSTDALANNVVLDADGETAWLHLEPTKPYVRLHAVVNFTGGTTPTVPLFGAVDLKDLRRLLKRRCRAVSRADR